jgi:hypothetical protein
VWILIGDAKIDKEDGFVITAFLTRRFKQIERGKKLWPQ